MNTFCPLGLSAILAPFISLGLACCLARGFLFRVCVYVLAFWSQFGFRYCMPRGEYGQDTLCALRLLYDLAVCFCFRLLCSVCFRSSVCFGSSVCSVRLYALFVCVLSSCMSATSASLALSLFVPQCLDFQVFSRW